MLYLVKLFTLNKKWSCPLRIFFSKWDSIHKISIFLLIETCPNESFIEHDSMYKTFWILFSIVFWSLDLFVKTIDKVSLRKTCPYSELFWSVFSHICTEYGEILHISPYSVRMRENTNQNNSKYGHFSHKVWYPFC